MTERNDDSTLAGGAASDDPNAIRAEIEDTRDRLGDTLEQIGDRLNPRNIAAQVKGSVREATVGKVQTAARSAADRVSAASQPVIERVSAASQPVIDRVSEASEPVMAKAREYPLPAVAAAAAIGWLLAGRRGGSSKAGKSRRKGSIEVSRPWESGYVAPAIRGAGFPESRPAATAGASSMTEVSPMLDASSTSGIGAAGGASAVGSTGATSSPGSIDDWRPTNGAGAAEYTDDGGDGGGRGAKVKAAASQLAGGARSAVGGATERVKGAGGAAAGQARRIVDRVQDSPLGMGAVTIAAGLAAGLAVPASEREVELMGDARDRFVDRVRGAVRQARGSAKEAAQQAVDETKAAAKQALHGA
jgi:uncharacterized protein YjbJ (UPF0337 family)